MPWTSFDRIVKRYNGDVGVRSLRCSEQFRIMAFAQMTYRDSFRDIEACLGAQPRENANKRRRLSFPKRPSDEDYRPSATLDKAV